MTSTPNGDESIFVKLSAAAAKHGALNLAQGVFDHGPPDAVLDALRRVGTGVEHQYAPSPGHPALRGAIAASITGLEGKSVDPDTEVTITAGATEAIFCTLSALLDDGGEVVLIEPAYEQYRPVVEAAGGVVRSVQVPTPDARLDGARLGAVCTDRTKAIVVNSPWNPWGRALDDDEWTAIATIATERGIVVVSDETYEHLYLDGERHRGVLDAIRDRELMVKISSASKTLGVTGWRIGWAVAGPNLTRRIRARHQFVTFCPAVPLQLAVADVVGGPDFPAIRQNIADLTSARVRKFIADLDEIGLPAYRPAVAFYVTADVQADAEEWCLRMLPGGGVAGLPIAAFFAEPPEECRSLVRFALCKSEHTLTEAIARIRARVAVGASK